MLKRDELASAVSCLSKANDNEMIFVLLGRDQAAADTVRYWAKLRVDLGKNKDDDPQIVEALQCAERMEIDFMKHQAQKVLEPVKGLLRELWKQNPNSSNNYFSGAYGDHAKNILKVLGVSDPSQLFTVEK